MWQAVRSMKDKQNPLGLSKARQKALEQEILAKVDDMYGNGTNALK